MQKKVSCIQKKDVLHCIVPLTVLVNLDEQFYKGELLMPDYVLCYAVVSVDKGNGFLVLFALIMTLLFHQK